MPPRIAFVRWRAALFVAAACGAAAAAPAQAPASYTLRDALASARQAANTVDFARVNPRASATLDSLILVLEASHATSLSVGQLAAIVQGSPPSFSTVARWNPGRYDAWSQPWFSQALRALQQVANTPLERELRARVPKAVEDSLLAPIDALGTAIIDASMVKGLEKLRRYEIKYGPDSPRLNIAEVALNYLAQFTPPFASDADGPSAFEIVASYSTADITASEANGRLTARVVSAARLGFRRYQFETGWGADGRLGALLRPSQVSGGLFIMGPRDGPLVRPWDRDSRTGAYLSWGSVQLGIVGGPHHRLVVGTGKQIIPYVF